MGVFYLNKAKLKDPEEISLSTVTEEHSETKFIRMAEVS